MKQTRLLEIIREEISEALNVLVTNKKGETTTMPFNTPDEKKSVTNLKSDSNITNIETTAGVNIKEDILNEIEQLAEMASMVQLKNQLEKQGKSDELEAVKAAEQTTINKLKDNPEFSGEGKNIRLKGYVKNLKKELKDAHGIDLQVLLSQVAAQAEKAGEDFKDDIATNTIEKNAAAQVLGTEKSKPGPQSSNKPKVEKSPKAKTEKAPKEKTTLAPKAEPMDDEDAEAAKSVGNDETAKELGKTSSAADKLAKLFQVKTTEEAKDKMKELAKKANGGDQKAKEFFDNPKVQKIIQAYRKAQKVNA
jgi:hypothetical protein